MSRLTVRKGGQVMLKRDIIPIGCEKPKFCNKKGCYYADQEKRSCPMLRLIDKLADLEDAIECGELKHSKNSYIICSVNGKDLSVCISDRYNNRKSALEALSLTYDAHLKQVDVVAQEYSFDEQLGFFKVSYTNGESYSAQIICV